MAEHQRKQAIGIVVSNKMEKTAIVEVTRRVQHPVYQKVMTRRKKYVAHDEQKAAKIGDKVLMVESKPISKTKRWRIVQILSTAS
ncbi:MAG: 30S ribosomal protein S17 [Omnitrophica bacterium RIFCSPHIGHO2_02_FULL_49_9]|nr:MAG: 30S ribosomal protein S17 [Omnitrophica bacterium RIFCSPHIGHO2_02_FULL_49_9]OGW88492.1 MAG: 30S ribosomal protein S17 [Omnitrophica bacterium RIFCSPLOWO2_01_FULL_50_24]